MGTNLNSTFRIATLQKKAIRIINNQPRNSHSSLLFKKSSIVKFEDKIHKCSKANQLIIYYHQYLRIGLSFVPIFTTMIVSSSADKLLKPSHRTGSYGKNSVIIGAINCWNKMQNILRN